MNILVTGGTGYIGKSVVSSLLTSGHNVTLLCRDLEKAKKCFINDNIKFISFDIADADNKIPQADILFHCSWEGVKNHLLINHIDTELFSNYRFLRACIRSGVKKVVALGTMIEYGKIYGPVSPDTVTQPNTPYGVSKDALHKMLRILERENDFELVWARIFRVYSKGLDNSGSVVSQFDHALNSGDKKFRMSGGEQLCDFLPLDEVGSKIAGLISSASAAVNICSGKPISLRRFLEERMIKEGKYIELELGYYPYRELDSMGIWGAL